ncbi:DNA-binding protein [Caballeronia sp. LP003]|uniref:DNA-binding protein n=1 Tax=Caballeronia sp. LP003 TaxID=3038551 RepID=UPI0028601000|nr:DNA-binding protein [Caballeronia sp. LP003]MDR5791683.1 DNA-binding protein [Caballeronia sp. LP003]
MARDPSITQEQVSKAAESIRESGMRPTARAIRERLGAGSMATVLKFLKAWQDTQVRQPDTPITLPNALQRGLIEFVASEVEHSRAEIQAELELTQQANADLIVESERQTLSIENLNATLEKAYAEKAEASGRLEQITLERDAALAASAAERRAAENARTDLAKALLRLEAMPRLEKEMDELRVKLEGESSARVSAEQSSAVAIAKLEGANEARATAERLIEEMKTNDQARAKEISDARSEWSTAQATIADLRQKLAALYRPRLPASRTIESRPRKKKDEGST